MHPVKFLSRGRGGGLWWPAGLLFDLVGAITLGSIMAVSYCRVRSCLFYHSTISKYDSLLHETDILISGTQLFTRLT